MPSALPICRCLGIIGDVHAEAERLARALAYLASRGVDLIACVGDIADGAGSVDRCCKLLSDAAAIVVSGNHDRWLLSGRMRSLPDATSLAAITASSTAFLASLPATVLLESTAGPLLLCHGLGSDEMDRINRDVPEEDILKKPAFLALKPAGIRFLVCGHTHQQFVRTIGDITIINPGTIRRPGLGGLAVVEFDDRSVELLTFDALRGEPIIVHKNGF